MLTSSDTYSKMYGKTINELIKEAKEEMERDGTNIEKFKKSLKIVGVILLIQLFNLQIIHGNEYRETSNTKLSREVTIEAARGKIYARTGTILADTKMGFNVELFKTKVSDDELNSALLIFSEIIE